MFSMQRLQRQCNLRRMCSERSITNISNISVFLLQGIISNVTLAGKVLTVWSLYQLNIEKLSDLMEQHGDFWWKRYTRALLFVLSVRTTINMSDNTVTFQAEQSEADLGMFSMFGRTGAPTKRGPTRGPANFCLVVMLTTLSLCVSCEFSRALKSMKLTVMSKKGRQFLEERKWGVLGTGPTFFLNRALLRLNPALRTVSGKQAVSQSMSLIAS